jgi:hypothetical protein
MELLTKREQAGGLSPVGKAIISTMLVLFALPATNVGASATVSAAQMNLMRDIVAGDDVRYLLEIPIGGYCILYLL